MSRPRLPIYLDHHATTPVDPRVLDAMLPFFTEHFGNAASVNHSFGWHAADAVEQARAQLGRLLNADPRGFVFTSGATEANNLAIKGVMQAAGKNARLVTSAAEHPSVLDPAKRLMRSGVDVTILPVDAHGRVDPEIVAEALQTETTLVSIMTANNEVGTINPITEIASICRERGVLFHTDAVQAAGRIPVDIEILGADLLSISAHKMYGPKGVGALYVRRGSPRIVIEPLFHGGGHERQLRSGTLPVPLLAGLGKACELAGEEMREDAQRIADLRDRLWAGLNASVDGIHRNGHPIECLPGNLNVSFDGVDGDALMSGLKDIAVSSGSACTSADPEPSHVLRAMGVNDSLTRASLRFGIGRFNTSAEIDHAVDEVVALVHRLRGTSSV